MTHCGVEWTTEELGVNGAHLRDQRHSCVRPTTPHKGEHRCGCGETLTAHPDDVEPPPAAPPPPPDLSWLTDEERSELARHCAEQASLLDDPRYWGNVYPPPATERSPEAAARRRARQHRWAQLAAWFGPGQYYGLPTRYHHAADLHSAP